MAYKNPESTSSTPVAYGLQSEAIDSDWVVVVEGIVQRHVHCRNVAPDRAQYRDQLAALGLVLGREVSRTTAGSDYVVPIGCRSLAQEEPSASVDSSVYTDADLIYDLGELSGKVARYCDNRVIQGPDAEAAFALVDFTVSQERQLFLAPGIESLLSEPVAGDPLNAQMLAFSVEFGDRFGAHARSFIQGYNEAREAV